MSELIARLLDVLKETLLHEERIVALLSQHKQVLVEAKEHHAFSALEEVDRHAQQVVELEQVRQEVSTQLATLSGVDPASFSVQETLELPMALSVREEFVRTTQSLREALRQITQLRDEITNLAQYAKAYSDMFLSLIHQATNQTGTYGPRRQVSSQFISVRT